MNITYFKQNILPTYSKRLGRMNENTKIAINGNEFESVSDFEFSIQFGLMNNKNIQSAKILRK